VVDQQEERNGGETVEVVEMGWRNLYIEENL